MSAEKNQKILIIEDEDALASVLNSKFQKEGYDSQVTYDGEEGYKAIKDFGPDLILLDIVMPKMNGYEVLEKMNDEGIKIPVIIISNSGQPVEIEKTKKLGAVDHLIKTEFDPQEVIDKVNKYMKDSNKFIEEKETVEPKMDESAEKKMGIKVLLVEDDSFLRDICSKKLVKEGFVVYEAIDGQKAIDEIEKVQPDVVLLDIVLPSVDGFGVLEKIRSNSDEKIKKVPIIMLSNLGQEDDVRKAMDLGANGYLIKANFTVNEIITKIKKELGK